MGKPLDLAGKRFGNLTYIRPVHKTKCGVKWLCECHCGATIELLASRRHTVTMCARSCPKYSKSAHARLHGVFLCDTHGPVTPKPQGVGFGCGQCANDKSVVKRKELKQLAVDFLGGCCNRCGYNKCLATLDFHHMDPGAKDFQISHYLNWDKIEPELLKCELLCSNCHREHHAN